MRRLIPRWRHTWISGFSGRCASAIAPSARRSGEARTDMRCSARWCSNDGCRRTTDRVSLAVHDLPPRRRSRRREASGSKCYLVCDDSSSMHLRTHSTGGFSGRTEEAVDSAGDQEVRILRVSDASVHQGARLLGRVHVPGKHGSDPLVRILSLPRQLAALPANERRLLLVALVLVAHVRVALCVLPSRFVLRIVRCLADLGPSESRAGRPAPDRIAWAIGAVSRVVPRATCLTQAVAGKLLLRHYGFESRLCLGVSKTSAGGFVAHAWIELESRILIGGAQSAAFSPLPPLSATFRREPPLGARR